MKRAALGPAIEAIDVPLLRTIRRKQLARADFYVVVVEGVWAEGLPGCETVHRAGDPSVAGISTCTRCDQQRRKLRWQRRTSRIHCMLNEITGSTVVAEEVGIHNARAGGICARNSPIAVQVGNGVVLQLFEMALIPSPNVANAALVLLANALAAGRASAGEAVLVNDSICRMFDVVSTPDIAPAHAPNNGGCGCWGCGWCCGRGWNLVTRRG